MECLQLFLTFRALKKISQTGLKIYNGNKIPSVSFEQQHAVLISTSYKATNPSPDFELTLTDRQWGHRVPIPNPLPPARESR
jgi:hypothetical protein